MCCLLTILVLLGARAVDIAWWIAQPGCWDLAFSSWVWPVLGITFLQWTTMSYVHDAPATEKGRGGCAAPALRGGVVVGEAQ
jgi:hypothetical protein